MNKIVATNRLKLLQFVAVLAVLALLITGCDHPYKNNEPSLSAGAFTPDTTPIVRSENKNFSSTDENRITDAKEEVSLTPHPAAPKEDYKLVPDTYTAAKTPSASPDNINSLSTNESKNDVLPLTIDAESSDKMTFISPDDIKYLSTDEAQMMKTIEKLTLAIRPIGSKEEKAACVYLKSELETYGYQTEIQEFPYIIQSLKLKNTPFQTGKFFDFDIVQPDGVSQNLIAVKKPTNKDGKDIIIVSAHYDSTFHTTGAIDNASGVAVLMEVARNIASFPSNIEVRFLLCGGEENYLYGSRYYVNSLSENDRQHIIAVINLDCIGEEGVNPVILGTSNGKENAATKLFADYDMQIERGPMSDYYSFEKAGIPALTIAQYPVMVGTGQPLPDDIARIDKAKLKAVADMVAKVLLEKMCHKM